MSLKIQFIQDPPFVVDFAAFKVDEKQESAVQKVGRVVEWPFFLLASFFEAIQLTLRTSGAAFTITVLGYHGRGKFIEPPANIYVAAIKICIWVLERFACLAVTTGRLFMEKVLPPTLSPHLIRYASNEMNLTHIKTNELELDTSSVPAELKVDDLMQIFQEINFDDPAQPGYMAPSSRQEGAILYSKEDLKASLEVFINNVSGRVAFLGTPPAYDTPRLLAYYKQLEDAVRLSIHKVNQDLNTFKEENGENLASYNEDQLKGYKNLLEDRARIALDLAIAGKHCGARYMGDAMEIYYGLYGLGMTANLNLHDTLIEILAHKRTEIARKHIAQHLGFNTHDFNNYMSNMGSILGIPGSKNIIEHLASSFDHNYFLSLFFKEYTVNCIIATIQEEIKKKNGAPLREKIIDWLKDQCHDWNGEKIQKDAEEGFPAIQEILHENPKELPFEKEIAAFRDLMGSVKELPVCESWDEFLQELFAEDAAKEWFQKQGMNVQQKHAFRTVISQFPRLHEMEPQAIQEALTKQVKVKKLRAFAQKSEFIMEEGTALNLLKAKDEEEAKAIFKDCLNLVRRSAFLDHLELENMAEQGLSKEFMEWLLVSQNVLLPQEGLA